MLTLAAQTLLAGMVATACMSVAMWAIHSLGLSRADMIRALGSLLTKRIENALLPGMVTHFLSGVMFAFPYAIVIGSFPLGPWWSFLTAGAILGLFHGFVVGFLLVAFVAENHPLSEFREVGVSVAAAHVAGHVVYGAVVGLVCWGTGIRWGLMQLAPVSG